MRNSFRDSDIKIAILDLNNGAKNKGIPLINRIVSNFVKEVNRYQPQITFSVSRFGGWLRSPCDPCISC